jgi:hypothetical protein
MRRNQMETYLPFLKSVWTVFSIDPTKYFINLDGKMGG